MFREYDSRLGKWLSIDPETAHFAWSSPYVSMSNNPIYRIDPLGNDDTEYKEVVNDDGTTTKTKVSDLGGDEVDFTHIKGGSHNYHLEWLAKDLFRRWKMTLEKKERDFLTANELSNLETYDFPIERLERVRGLFLFGCYTGISYVDIKNLKPKHILEGMDGNNWIITHRQKTKTKVKVPLFDKAKLLLEEYENHPMAVISETLFPIISNEKVNLYLKEIANPVGIKKNLTFHMARHTFATTVTLSNGVPIETVSKLLGHTRVATTQIYARVLEEKLSVEMIELQKILTAKGETKKY